MPHEGGAVCRLQEADPALREHRGDSPQITQRSTVTQTNHTTHKETREVKIHLSADKTVKEAGVNVREIESSIIAQIMDQLGG